MDSDQVRGFYFVAKLGSFTAAASHLLLTQPAISLQVKALEKELGERLFDREGRGIRLTHAGKILFGHAEDLVEKLDEIARVATELKDVERGRLALGASDTTSIHILPQLLERYVAAHPAVELSISSSFSSEVARRLRDGGLDLGIVTHPLTDDRLESEPLFSQELVLIVSRSHRWARRRRIELDTLDAERVILLETGSSTRSHIDALLSARGVEFRPAMELSNFEIIKRYVEAGLGLSLVPSSAVDRGRDRLVAIPITSAPTIEVGIAYRRGQALTHAARAFLDLAKGHFRGENARFSPNDGVSGGDPPPETAARSGE